METERILKGIIKLKSLSTPTNYSNHNLLFAEIASSSIEIYSLEDRQGLYFNFMSQEQSILNLICSNGCFSVESDIINEFFKNFVLRP